MILNKNAVLHLHPISISEIEPVILFYFLISKQENIINKREGSYTPKYSGCIQRVPKGIAIKERTKKHHSLSHLEPPNLQNQLKALSLLLCTNQPMTEGCTEKCV